MDVAIRNVSFTFIPIEDMMKQLIGLYVFTATQFTPRVLMNENIRI